MKCEVKLIKAGTVFTEEVIAIDYQDARKVALARNPGATIIGVNAKFYTLGDLEICTRIILRRQNKRI